MGNVEKYKKQWKKEVDDYYENEWLTEMYIAAGDNVRSIYEGMREKIFTDEELESILNDTSRYVNIDSIKRHGKYEYYLHQMYRMGYKPYRKAISEDWQEQWRELNDSEKDRLVVLAVVMEKIYKEGYNPGTYDTFKGVIIGDKPVYYVRDCRKANYFGDGSIDFVNNFDQAVRAACTILNDKGYKTYWSSANSDDISSRTGDIVKDKNVAYILIDPSNLTDELKKRLFLNGNNNVWGLALRHADKENPEDEKEVGKYYGIWAEITSPDMSCYELSEKLVEEAIALPSLVNKHEIVRQQIEDKKNSDPHRRI